MQELVAELTAPLAGTRFLAVVGPSGSGKSSAGWPAERGRPAPGDPAAGGVGGTAPGTSAGGDYRGRRRRRARRTASQLTHTLAAAKAPC